MAQRNGGFVVDMYSLKDELALRRRLLFRLHNKEARRTFEAVQAHEVRAKNANIASDVDAVLFGSCSSAGEDSFVFK